MNHDHIARAITVQALFLAGLVQAQQAPGLDEVAIRGQFDNGIGMTDAASAGHVTPRVIEERARLHPGEVLEYVPGMIVTQHSGAGKANQYFLRGFNLDHGTDFATRVAGMPVNLRSHAHGQGYTDLNFLIPELVSRIDYSKGPYQASQGDFATAGAADIHYASSMRRSLAETSAGTFGYGRAVVAGSTAAAAGEVLYAVETVHNNGPWQVPENLRKHNAVMRFSQPLGAGKVGITAMAYEGRWAATDQIPERAVASGLVPRFGSLDPSDGGTSRRSSLSVDYEGRIADGRMTSTAYAIRSDLDLYSNFTYWLHDPVNGDQFNQADSRRVVGWHGRWTLPGKLGAFAMRNSIGWDLRQDRITPLGLYDTAARERLSTVREDRVRESSAALWLENQMQWTTWLRTVAGWRGERFNVDVASNTPDGSGARAAGIGLPKLSIIVGPWHDTEFFVNAGEGFHSNDARGVTGRTPTSSPTAATPLVRAKGAETGLRTESIRHLQSSLTLWHLALDSELLFRGDTGATEASRPAVRSGVEWSNHYTLMPWLLLDLDLAWTRARFEGSDPAGNHVPESLRATAQGGITVRDAGPWSATVFARYIGPRDLNTNATVRSNATTTVNFQATRRLAAQTRVRLEAFNLLDARANDITYFYISRLPGEAAAGIADRLSHPMARRTLRATLIQNF